MKVVNRKVYYTSPKSASNISKIPSLLKKVRRFCLSKKPPVLPKEKQAAFFVQKEKQMVYFLVVTVTEIVTFLLPNLPLIVVLPSANAVIWPVGDTAAALGLELVQIV